MGHYDNVIYSFKFDFELFYNLYILTEPVHDVRFFFCARSIIRINEDFAQMSLEN